MTTPACMSLTSSVARVGLALLTHFLFAGSADAQAPAISAGPTYAEVPEDIQVRFVFKSSGNYNMVATSDIPVIVSVVLTNKTEEPLAVFVTRFLSREDDKPLDFPLGCAIRLTDAKGTMLLQRKESPDGYWTSLTTDAPDDSGFRKDSRNKFEVPPKERRAFSIPLGALLAGGGTGPEWPVTDGKFAPGAYRFKVRWGGKESPEFSLTVMPK